MLPFWTSIFGIVNDLNKNELKNIDINTIRNVSKIISGSISDHKEIKLEHKNIKDNNNNKSEISVVSNHLEKIIKSIDEFSKNKQKDDISKNLNQKQETQELKTDKKSSNNDEYILL